MLTDNEHVAQKSHSDGVLTKPIFQTLTADTFMVGSESNKVCITFGDDTQQSVAIRISSDVAGRLGHMLLQSVSTVPDRAANSFSENGDRQNGQTPPMEDEAPHLESDDAERRARIYEEIKDHPLAGLVGLFSDADESAHVEDASMNIHKYLAEYHEEQHARLSN